MTVNYSGLYAAFQAKDARFDGRFFVGISSTGIYCRPVCRARQPKRNKKTNDYSRYWKLDSTVYCYACYGMA